MKSFVTSFLFAGLVWLAVTWNFGLANFVIGAVVCALLAWSLRRLELKAASSLLLPQRLLWALLYIPVLLLHVVRANLDVAYRVLHPALPIRPGIVKARTSLTSLPARVLLANSVTLTPGTLTVDLLDDVLYVHRIHLPEGDADAQTTQELKRLESFIRRIFE